MADSADHNVSAAELLRALAREMGQMAASCERLQTILVLACAAAGNKRFLSEAQDCDLLTQKLINLTDFFDRLACMAPKEWTIDAHKACQSISLADMTARLCLEPTIQTDEAGELEFFS